MDAPNAAVRQEPSNCSGFEPPGGRRLSPKGFRLKNQGDGDEGQKYLGEKNEAIRVMSLVDGKPASYVCENFTCKVPVTNPKALSELLSK